MNQVWKCPSSALFNQQWTLILRSIGLRFRTTSYFQTNFRLNVQFGLWWEENSSSPSAAEDVKPVERRTTASMRPMRWGSEEWTGWWSGIGPAGPVSLRLALESTRGAQNEARPLTWLSQGGLKGQIRFECVRSEASQHLTGLVLTNDFDDTCDKAGSGSCLVVVLDKGLAVNQDLLQINFLDLEFLTSCLQRKLVSLSWTLWLSDESALPTVRCGFDDVSKTRRSWFYHETRIHTGPFL